jgi:hypothetical protein
MGHGLPRAALRAFSRVSIMTISEVGLNQDIRSSFVDGPWPMDRTYSGKTWHAMVTWGQYRAAARNTLRCTLHTPLLQGAARTAPPFVSNGVPIHEVEQTDLPPQAKGLSPSLGCAVLCGALTHTTVHEDSWSWPGMPG